MQYKTSLNEELLKLLDDISAYRDINNDFPNRDFEKELSELENLGLKLFKLKLSKYEGFSKVKVAVIGNFSSGKSSFINSLLGADICPVKVNPTTSAVTKFVYGDIEEIFLIDENGNKRKINRDEYLNLCQHDIKTMEKTKGLFFEYRYPSPILKNIELYDTPGFENAKNPKDEEITREIATKQADIILFIQDIQKGTVEETTINKIKEIRESSPAREWYLIFNKADTKPSIERQEIARNFKELEISKFFNSIHFYSAKKVIEALKFSDEGDFESLKDWLKSMEEGKYKVLITKRVDENLESKTKKRKISKRSSKKKRYLIEIHINKDCNCENFRDFLINIIFKSRFKNENFNIENRKFRINLIDIDVNPEFLEEREKLISIFNGISSKKDQFINEEIRKLTQIYNNRKREILKLIYDNTNLELLRPEVINLDKILDIFRKEFQFKVPKHANNSIEIFIRITKSILLDYLSNFNITEEVRSQIINSYEESLKKFISNLKEQENAFPKTYQQATLSAFSKVILLNIIENLIEQQKIQAKAEVNEIKEKIKKAMQR